MIAQEDWISQSGWAVCSMEKAWEQRKPGHGHPNPWATQLFINPSCLWPPGFMIHHNSGIWGSIPFPRNVYKGQAKADFQGLCDAEFLENNCINCKIKLNVSSELPFALMPGENSAKVLILWNWYLLWYFIMILCLPTSPYSPSTLRFTTILSWVCETPRTLRLNADNKYHCNNN